MLLKQTTATKKKIEFPLYHLMKLFYTVPLKSREEPAR